MSWALARDAWVTVHPNPGAKGQHVEIGAGGKVEAGLGSKFNGKPIGEVHGNPEKPKEAASPVAPTRAKPAKLTGSEKAAAEWYTGQGSTEINKGLREGKTNLSKTVASIDNAIGKSPMKPGAVVYRGISRDDLKKLLGGGSVNKGDVFSDPAFTSTSSSYGTAANYGGGVNGAVLQIECGEGQKGLDMKGISLNQTESEILLPRNTKMRVTGIVAPKKVGQPVIVKVTTEPDGAHVAKDCGTGWAGLAKAWKPKADCSLGQDAALVTVALILAMDAAGERWITIHSGGEGGGSRVKLDRKGKILAGMGGKFTGQKIGEIGKKAKAKAQAKARAAESSRWRVSAPASYTFAPVGHAYNVKTFSGEQSKAALAAGKAVNKPHFEISKFTGNEDAPKTKGAPVGVFMFNAKDLKTDANRFQYKDNGDKEGVTVALKGVTKWDASKANQVIAWEDHDGQVYVVDGHQRSGLARRLIAGGHESEIHMPGILYRAKDGVSADDIRCIAAAKNIAEGSGSPIDGAKILRSRPELMDGSMPISRTEARQSFELASLNDEAFRMVTNEVVPYQQAAVVGRYIPKDADRQNAAMKALARFEPRNETEAQVLVQRVAQSELEKAEEGRQTSMFGDLDEPESTAGEEMKIVAKAIGELKKDKSLFARVVKNAGRIEETGSQIERESAEGVKQDAEVFIRRLTSEAYSQGPLRTKLVAAARNLKNGKSSIGEATDDILSALRGAGEGDVPSRSGHSGGTGEREHDGGGLFKRDTEEGPDGTRQTLIDGVKPVTNKERLDVAAGKPMRGGHDPMDVGMFGGPLPRDMFSHDAAPRGWRAYALACKPKTADEADPVESGWFKKPYPAPDDYQTQVFQPPGYLTPER